MDRESGKNVGLRVRKRGLSSSLVANTVCVRMCMYLNVLCLSAGRSPPAPRAQSWPSFSSKDRGQMATYIPHHGQGSTPSIGGPAPLPTNCLPTQASLMQTPSGPEAPSIDHMCSSCHSVPDPGTLQHCSGLLTGHPACLQVVSLIFLKA